MWLWLLLQTEALWLHSRYCSYQDHHHHHRQFREKFGQAKISASAVDFTTVLPPVPSSSRTRWWGKQGHKFWLKDPAHHNSSLTQPWCWPWTYFFLVPLWTQWYQSPECASSVSCCCLAEPISAATSLGIPSRNAMVSIHPDPASVISWLPVHPVWKHTYGN